MPIPTDTFWNIRRLNVAFAASSVILMLVMGWAVFQDYQKDFRTYQQDSKTWEAALAQEAIDRALTRDERLKVEELDQKVAVLDARLKAQEDQGVGKWQGEIHKIESNITTLSGRFNDRKSNVTVTETQYQDALAAGDTETARKLLDKLSQPTGDFSRKQLAKEAEDLAGLKDELKNAKEELAALKKERDDLEKAKKQLLEDREALVTKKTSLDPESFVARHISTPIRRTPLLQFLNPAEAVKQTQVPDVLTDMGGFKKVETVDRCISCHANIGKKEFAEDRVLAYLERQVAGARGVRPLPPATSVKDPTQDRDTPGAIAMAEFWHAWGRKLLPAEAWTAKATAEDPSLDEMANGIVAGAAPWVRPATLSKEQQAAATRIAAALKAKEDANVPVVLTEADRQHRDVALPGVLNELYTRFDTMASAAGAAAGDDAADRKKRLEQARAAAHRYPVRLRDTLTGQLSADAVRLLLDRYRRALVAEVNVTRDKQGLAKLDDGRVILAHPNLKLYVDVESPHPLEGSEGKLGVGCTSCHDGSGQETSFVLAAHMSRRIWVDEKTGEPVHPMQLVEPPHADEGPTLASMLEGIYPQHALIPAAVSSLHMELGAPNGNGKPNGQSNGHGNGNGHQGVVAAAVRADPSAVETAPEHAPDKPVTYADPVTGKQGRAVPQSKYWADRYEAEGGRSFKLVYHEWDWPMRPPQYLQANCVRCHSNVNDIREYAPVVAEGRALFSEMGCVNCHQMDSIPPEQRRQVGTDLRHVTSKLSPEFINTWVFAPKSFRPTTKMPHFFLLENNSSDEEVRRTRQEARAITEYLVRTATPLPPKHRIPAGLAGDAKKGKEIFRAVGCMACHTNLNLPALDPENPGQEIEGLTVGEQWVTMDLVKKGEIARALRPAVAADVTKRLAEGVEERARQRLKDQAEQEFKDEINKRLTDVVKEELTPKGDDGQPKKLTKAESDKLKRDITAEVRKRATAEFKKVQKTELPKRVEAATTPEKLGPAIEEEKAKLPALTAETIESELADRTRVEAKKLFDGMTYNERQVYALVNLDAPQLIVNTPPGSLDASVRPASLPRYADGTPKPLFINHGPELSGIGTKLLDHRTPEQARQWLFDWVKEPRHYNSYTVMPNLRLTDEEALHVVEHLLAQRRDGTKTYDTAAPVAEGENPKELPDPWASGLAPPDTEKLKELTAFFLRSRYSLKKASEKADDDKELRDLAVEALTSPTVDTDAAIRIVDAILAAAPSTQPSTRPAGPSPATAPVVAVASADPAAGVTEAAAPASGPAAPSTQPAAPATQPTTHPATQPAADAGATPATQPSTQPATQPTTAPAAVREYVPLAAGTSPVVQLTSAASAKDQLRMIFLGKKLIGHYGCMSCHAINGVESLSSPCANLSDWGQKQVSKLDYAYVDQHKVHDLAPDARTRSIPMVNGLSDAAAVLAHADFAAVRQATPGRAISRPVQVGWPEVGHTRDDWITQKLKNTRIYDRGKELLEPHALKLPDGSAPDPGKPYDKLRMPTFYLRDDQVHAIVTFVLSNRDPLVTPRMLQKAKPDNARQIAYGRFLVEKYNCVGCHQTERNVPPVQQYYKPDELTSKAPPSLWGEGSRIQHDWLVYFLENVGEVGPIRPTLQPVGGIRMPQFPFAKDGEEAAAIAAYFAAVANREAAQLARLLDPINKHYDAELEREKAKKKSEAERRRRQTASAQTRPAGAPPPAGGFAVAGAEVVTPPDAPASTQPAVVPVAGPAQPPEDVIKADAWFREPGLAESAKALKQWAFATREMLERDFDLARNAAPGDLEQKYARLLFKARYIEDLWKTPYPFVDKGVSSVSDEEFKKGETLFYTVGCISCHTISPEVNASGAALEATVVAPNLIRAGDRIQARWSRWWVQEPDMVQIDTKMTKFFSGYDHLKLKGHPWSPTIPPDDAQRDAKLLQFHNLYGHTADEQIDLLTRFVWATAGRRYTATRPTQPDAPQPFVPGVTVPLDPATIEAAKQIALARAAAATQPSSTAGHAAVGSPATGDAGKVPTTSPATGAAGTPVAGAGPRGGKVSVSGSVKFKGTPPPAGPVAGIAANAQCAALHRDLPADETYVVDDEGNLANVAVYVSAGLEGKQFPVPSEPVVIDQKGCQYVPHVAAMMVGQQLVAKNADPFLHNVHALPTLSEQSNTAQPTIDRVGITLKPVKAPEPFKVKCDVHPWMGCWVVAVDNPFYDVSADDGTFSLRGLPPGKYTLTAWHEAMGTRQQEVTVTDGEPVAVKFEFEKK